MEQNASSNFFERATPGPLAFFPAFGSLHEINKKSLRLSSKTFTGREDRI